MTTIASNATAVRKAIGLGEASGIMGTGGVGDGLGVVEAAAMRYSIRVMLVSGMRVSFWMATGLPVALARAQAMALLNRQPTCL